jgi:hypothetical protein
MNRYHDNGTEKLSSIVARFAQDLGHDKCWPWPTGKKGRSTHNGVLPPVAKIMLIKKLGRPLRRGCIHQHSCADPTCFNPRHIFEGARFSGEMNPGAVLLLRQVRRIKTSTAQTRDLVARYGVHRNTIQRIRRGALWPDV